MRAVLLLVVFAVGCGKKDGGNGGAPPVGGAEPKTVEKEKRWTREEAHAALRGKTRDEVKAIIGKPDDTLKVGNDSVWFYRTARIIYDPAAEKYAPFHVKFDAAGLCYDVR